MKPQIGLLWRLTYIGGMRSHGPTIGGTPLHPAKAEPLIVGSWLFIPLVVQSN